MRTDKTIHRVIWKHFVALVIKLSMGIGGIYIRLYLLWGCNTDYASHGQGC